jgi:crotonobetainyl-CoA:carnitine CoA-transferase CaiB-like acyl-CoA transferase
MRVPSDVYHTRDGAHVYLMVHHDRVWAPFCRAIERPEWIEHPRYATNRLRCGHRDELNRMVFERFAAYDVSEITARLAAERVPHAVVNDYVQAVSDSQVMHRGVVQEVTHSTSGAVRVVGPPWLVDGEPVKVSSPPALGEHLAEVLHDWLGWDPDRIRQFSERNRSTGAL